MALRQVSLADKYQLAEGQIFLTGVQALVRLPLLQRVLDQAAGLKTAGYVTGYPGSPLASYDIQLRQAQSTLKEGGVIFEPALNEDLAMTAIWGTQQGEVRGDSLYDGVFAMWYGKGAGLDRSGDALRHGNLAGASKNGGVLLLLGDDHRAESSSVAHYSEYTLVDYMAPVLNPANVADIIEFGLYGFALSRFAGVWVGLKSVHDVVESAGSIPITSKPRKYVTPSDAVIPPDGLNLRLPDTPLAQEFRLHTYRLDAVRAFVRANPVDKAIWRRPDSRFGIVTAGKSHLDVMEALDDLGIDETMAGELGIALYKVGMSYPLEPVGATKFADGLETIFVVEEKRALVEAQLKEILYHREQRPQIVGKVDAKDAKVLPSTGILTSNQLAVEIGRRLVARPGGERIAQQLARIEQREAKKVMPFMMTERKPTFCSGCPHNRSTVVPEGSRAGAGTGCGFMSIWMGRRTEGFTQMGADGVSWIGEAAFSKRKHVIQNMGDGTYRHSGILAIRACVAARVNITFKLLFNGVVAMTGGQPHQIAVSPAGIASQVLAEGVQRCVIVTDDVEKEFGELPSGVAVRPREQLNSVQRELRELEGVTVLIYDQMCATEKRRQRKRGLMPDPSKRVFINHLVCEGCGDCGVKSNCVSIAPRETELGRKREIDQHTCNKDYSCVEGFCPSFVTIDGGTLRKPEVRTVAQPSTPLPDPPKINHDRQVNIILSGVGGTGVVTLAAVLGMAAHLEGKGVATLDMMGLAQKGGAVTSYLRIAPDASEVRAARVPGGAADLLLGFDVLAAVGVEPLSTVGEQTIVLANTNELMPPEFTTDRDLEFPKRAARARLEAAAGEGNVMYVDANARAATAVGDTIAANTYMLGIAFQRGLIPLSIDAIERAFELNGVEIDLNKRAFRAGRQAVVSGFEEAVGSEGEAPPLPLDTLIEHRAKLLRDYQNEGYANTYRDFVDVVRKAEAKLSGEPTLTRAVAENLAKLMAYKDEYEVARLYTSGEFEADLRSRFSGDFRMTVLLAPPLLARRDPDTGEPRKMSFGPWIMPAFRLLAKLRGLRGTALDIFGHTDERRMERQLIVDYKAMIAKVLERLGEHNREVALALASLPQDIRGFGHVKDASIAVVKAREAELMAMLEQRPDASRASSGSVAPSAVVR